MEKCSLRFVLPAGSILVSSMKFFRLVPTNVAIFSACPSIRTESPCYATIALSGAKTTAHIMSKDFPSCSMNASNQHKSSTNSQTR